MDSEKSDGSHMSFSMKMHGVYCTACVAVLTKTLLSRKGIHSVKVSPQFDEVQVEYATDAFGSNEIEKIVKSAIADSLMPHTTDTELSSMDPVCQMPVHIDDKQPHSDFDGTRYYFCSKSCKDAFDEKPESFIGSAQ